MRYIKINKDVNKWDIYKQRCKQRQWDIYKGINKDVNKDNEDIYKGKTKM